MAVDDLRTPDLAPTLLSETIVGIDGPNAEPYILPLSCFDRMVEGYRVTQLFVYRKPSSRDFSSVLSTIKNSLPKALDRFFPFAGTIVHYSTNGEVICNNRGARLVEASANFPLSQLNFYDLDRLTKNTLLTTSREYLLDLQVTRYACGGFSVAWTYDHQLAGEFGFNKLVASFCEIARTGEVSLSINHERSFLLCPRSPPTFSTLINNTFTVIPSNEKLDLPQTGMTCRHLYFVEGSTLESLREKSSSGGSRRTRTEALSAYIWKVMASTIDGSNGARCRMGFIVDGRSRMGEDMSSFVGNIASMAVREERVRSLEERLLAEVAEDVSAAIRGVTNRDHFLDLIDWAESREEGKGVAEIVLGRVPAIVVNSVHHIPMMLADFGFGQPSLSVSLPTRDCYCPGYVSMASTGRGDGSWFVSVIIWPELAEALESDSDRVFRPEKALREAGVLSLNPALLEEAEEDKRSSSPLGELIKVPLDETKPDRCVQVGTALSEELKERLISCL